MNKTLKSSVNIMQWWFKTTRDIQRELPSNIRYGKISDGRQFSVTSQYISPYCPNLLSSSCSAFLRTRARLCSVTLQSTISEEAEAVFVAMKFCHIPELHSDMLKQLTVTGYVDTQIVCRQDKTYRATDT